MNNKRETVQSQFFEVLLQKFEKKTIAVEAISNLLSIGKDAVYRRLRGDSLLTPDELKILAVNYRISIDELLFQKTDKVFFTFSSFSNPIDHFDTYLKELKKNIDSYQPLPGAEVIYTTAEIPMFYYGLSPELMCFKLYIWGKTVWKLSFLENEKFSMDLFSANTMKLINELIDNFLKMKTTEFWCINILDNSLNQIEYVLNNGNFANEKDAIMLCDSLLKVSDYVAEMAKHGKRIGRNSTPEESKVPFELYHNELVYTNNIVLFKSDVVDVVFSTFDSPNFLLSGDERIVSHVKDWMNGIQLKSEYISVVAEKNRNQFFNRLNKKVNQTKVRVEAIIGE